MREKHETILPLGKVVGIFYRDGMYKGVSEDLVDAEAITLVLLRGIIFITTDQPTVIQERVASMRETLNEIQKVLGISFEIHEGKVICLHKKETEHPFALNEVI